MKIDKILKHQKWQCSSIIIIHDWSQNDCQFVPCYEECSSQSSPLSMIIKKKMSKLWRREPLATKLEEMVIFERFESFPHRLKGWLGKFSLLDLIRALLNKNGTFFLELVWIWKNIQFLENSKMEILFQIFMKGQIESKINQCPILCWRRC